MKKLKLTFAHAVLIAGSLMFLIPFVWLISTSLKTDEEQAVFPPVWIPTQQITTEKLKNAEGEPSGISWLKTPNGKTQVAELESFGDGKVKVQNLQTNTTQTVAREDLEKIRHASPRW